jgi:D-3-phosphoglycerate dehydrogenase
MFQYFIIDFDSTFVTIESLDNLAKIALQNNPKRNEILTKISFITNQGMEGKIPFNKSLEKRVKLFQSTRENIDELIVLLKNSITPSIERNREFFSSYKDHIYIISGGFKEYIYPVAREFGIAEDHILANTFKFNKNRLVTGFDKKNNLSKAKGKVLAIKSLKLNGNAVVIGDGFTDYEIVKEKAAGLFVAFTENVKRESILKVADKKVKSFDEFLHKFNLPRKLSYPKSKMKVLLLENIHATAVEAFKKEGYEIEYEKKALSEEELVKRIKNVSVLGIRSKTQISKNVIDNADKLLAIGAFCIGTNNIDLKSAAEKGIVVFNAPYSATRSVSELIIGEIILLARQVFVKSTQLHNGEWNKEANGCFEIRGKKLGIIGYGNIGSQLSVIAENLGMSVLFYDIADKLALGNSRKCNSMEELLRESDIVTIHVDGRKSNENLIGEKEFSQMKKGTLFLNASRGFIVNIGDLARAIQSGHIAGAAVDVYPKEPKANGPGFVTPLQGLQNVILTPHIGASTEEAQSNIGVFVSGKLIQFVNTGTTTLTVNFPEIQLSEVKDAHRLIHIHKNTPGVLAQINNIFAGNKINILGQYLKTNELVGYVITDVNKEYSTNIISQLKNMKETIRVRVLY